MEGKHFTDKRFGKLYAFLNLTPGISGAASPRPSGCLGSP